MYILFDNSDLEKNIIFYTLNNKWVHKEFAHKTRRSDLLLCLQKVLFNLKKEMKDIEGIAVLMGSGSFTSTRLATTIANTLAYALQIPVLGIKKLNLDKLKNLIQRQRVGIYVSPIYSGEANIGISKK